MRVAKVKFVVVHNLGNRQLRRRISNAKARRMTMDHVRCGSVSKQEGCLQTSGNLASMLNGETADTYHKRIWWRGGVELSITSFIVGFGKTRRLEQPCTVHTAFVNAFVEQVLVNLRLLINDEATSDADSNSITRELDGGINVHT